MHHVMLIEDEPHIAEAICFILRRDGLQVTPLSDGTGAVEAVRTARPDMLILDLMLPGASGLEIVAGLRADAVMQGLPVLMLTAKGQGRDREAALQAGVTQFMTKPFANAEMLAAVRALLP
jgi:DNA-binding response OmpR family regulator